MIQDYFKPASVDEALAIKKNNPGGVWFAGGTEINYPLSGMDTTCAIALESLGLNALEMKGNTLVVGSMVTLQELIDSPLTLPVLREAASAIYSRNIRNIATLGGNLGAKRRDSALIPCLVALSALVETAEAGMMTAEDFVTGDHKRLITAIHIPKQPGSCGFKKISRSAASEPILHAAVSIDGIWGSVQEAIIALGCIVPPGTRLKDVESALKKGVIGSPEELEAAVAGAVHPESDTHGSAEYKRYITGVIVADCVAGCMRRR